jgi:hypothetical protein
MLTLLVITVLGLVLKQSFSDASGMQFNCLATLVAWQLLWKHHSCAGIIPAYRRVLHLSARICFAIPCVAVMLFR